MTPVWHDGASILVNGSEPYPSRSLYAESRGEMIWSIAHNGFVVARLPWAQYCRQDGSGFGSQTEALAYLQGEYGKPSAFAIGDVLGLQAALDGRALVIHTHAISDVTGLQVALDGKAAANHTHSIAQVTGLQSALDAKQAAGSYAPLVHSHVIADVSGLQTALDGKALTSHTHTIAQVTGLQAALDGKQVAGNYAAASHTHVIADVTGLQAALDGKQAAGSYAPLVHTHAIADVTGLATALAGKAALVHTHVIADVSGLQAALDGKLGSSVAPAVSTRALNTTFQPSATKAVRVAYTVKTQVTNPLLVGTSTATVTLLSDAANPPTTERGRVESTSGVGITVTIALTTSNTMMLSYIVPAGHYVRLVSAVTGTGTTAIVSQVEEVLG